MRNRKKWKFIRKNGEDNISKFDRQTINRYPGKRLPIRRRSLNSNRNTWFYKHNAWIPSKYIEGLLTKYIGKPYSEFKRKYDERTQSIRDKGVNTDKELSTYFNPRCNPDFYVDNDGFIQVARKNSFWDNYKKYSEYNKDNLKISNPGKVRSIPLEKWYLNSFNNYIQKPIYIGTGFIYYKYNTYKVPIYITDSKVAANSLYKGNFWMPHWKREVEKFGKEWIAIENIPGIPNILHHYVKELNPEVNKYNKAISESNDVDRINNYKLILSTLSKEVVNDYGVGQILFLIKKKDINESNCIKLF